MSQPDDGGLTPPIRVHETPTPEQVAAGLRQLLLAAAAIAAALGYADAAGKFSALCAAAGPAALFIVFVWGQIATRRGAQTKAALAERLPDTIATFK